MEQIMTNIRSKGITGSTIKWIALALMVLDHIHYFFEFTGAVPLWFSWLGRLSAWLFILSVVEGFTHTRNRKRYFLKIWSIGAVMGLIQILIMTFAIRSDGFFPLNGIFSTFTVLIVIWQGIDWIKQKKILLGTAAILLPFALLAVAMMMPGSLIVYYIRTTILPLPLVTEGGILTLAGGIMMYLFKDNRKLQAVMTSLVIILFTVYAAIISGTGFGASLLSVNYEWMGVFAFLITMLYNGKRGNGPKKWFYFFYPVHVYVFYIISFVIILIK